MTRTRTRTASPHTAASALGLELDELRAAIRGEYEAVARTPDQGFHFNTGRPLARILGYEEAWLDGIPEAAIESFAGTGNPFSLGIPEPGSRVVDVGCGAGIDSLIAARMVGDDGAVIGVQVEDRSGKIEIHLGPIAGDDYHDLVGDEARMALLRFLVGTYLVQPFAVDLLIHLTRGSHPSAHLGGSTWSRLGEDTWVGVGSEPGEAASQLRLQLQ